MEENPSFKRKGFARSSKLRSRSALLRTFDPLERCVLLCFCEVFLPPKHVLLVTRGRRPKKRGARRKQR